MLVQAKINIFLLIVETERHKNFADSYESLHDSCIVQKLPGFDRYTFNELLLFNTTDIFLLIEFSESQ